MSEHQHSNLLEQRPKLSGQGPVIAVDDDEDFLAILRFTYKKCDLSNELLTFTCGYSCVDYLKSMKSGEGDIPSIILLDINMPRINGFDTLKLIRAEDQFVDVPIVCILSTSDADADIEKAEQLGADGYQVKPFDVKQMMAFLNSLQ